MSVNSLSNIMMIGSNTVSASQGSESGKASREFRKKISIAMKVQGKSQKAIEKMTGGAISQNGMSNLLNGKLDPSFVQAAKIAEALGLSLEYLADDEMKTPPEKERSEVESEILRLANSLGHEETMWLLGTAIRMDDTKKLHWCLLDKRQTGSSDEAPEVG